MRVERREEFVPPDLSQRLTKVTARLLWPIERFLRVEASSALLLIGSAAAAMLVANSRLAPRYRALLDAPLGFSVGATVVAQPAHFWVGNALMTLFFLVVGLELRREIEAGELASLKRAAHPLIAAIGGMLAPALLYVALTTGNAASLAGWGIPMSTDVAFAAAVLALLGRRVPTALRAVLLAMAIIDDVGSMLVVGLFYSAGFHADGLVFAGLGVGLTLGLQRLRVRAPLAYVVPGAVVWLGFLRGGVNPTLAGVVMGSLAPASQPHVRRVEAALHPWVAFGVLPLFAFANAGVTLTNDGSLTPTTISLGIVVGRVVGKPIGIVMATMAASRARLIALPQTFSWREIVVLGLIGGIGFTVAIFIASLAFHDPASLNEAKVATVAASVVAGVAGLLAGRCLLPPSRA